VTVVTVLIVIGVFVTSLWLCGLAAVAGETLATTRRAAAALREPGLDDRARESAARGASSRLAMLFASMVFRTAVVMTVSAVPIWLASALGLAGGKEVVALLAGWQTAVIATAALGAWVLWTRMWPTS
jgi:hypothetical protein